MYKEISIKEWINSDDAKRLESEEDYKKWELFEIVGSDKAYEEYGNLGCKVENITYAIGCGDEKYIENIKKWMFNALRHCREVAIAEKVEGMNIGEGRLIIQERRPITISIDNDKKGHYKIVWRGRMKRI